MEISDPYRRYNTTYDAPAAEIFRILPSDTDLVAKGVKRIRVFNPVTEVMMCRIRCVKGEPVDLAIPPLSIIWEDLRVVQVFDTGTDDGLIVHGYTD
jgi:hypothetical protein